MTLSKKYDDKKHMKENHHMKKKAESLGVTTLIKTLEEKQFSITLKARDIYPNTGSECRQSEI